MRERILLKQVNPYTIIRKSALNNNNKFASFNQIGAKEEAEVS
jgi:hypothetical protein